MSSTSGKHLMSRNERTGKVRGWYYQTETLRPLVCLLYVLPILFTYELGAIFADNQSIRNGLDVWASQLVSLIGGGEFFLLPVLTAVTLLVMHHRRQDKWEVRPVVFLGMLIESFGLALIILCGVKAQHLFLSHYSTPSLELLSIGSNELGSNESAHSPFLNLVSFCGAGLYEELVFRLLMLPGLTMLLLRAGVKQWMAVIIAVAVTSLVFAAAHYDILNSAAGPFEWPGFAVRTVASLFFCAVFLLRGFGVAVGTHVAYDLLAQMLT